MNRTFWPAILILALGFAIFESTGIDLRVQDCLYNFQTRAWLVDEAAPIPRFLFYTGPKALVWLIGLSILCSAIFYAKFPSLKIPRRDLLIAVLTIATAPALVSLSKATTNTFTPAQIRRYNGTQPYVKVIEHYADKDKPTKRGRAFPAGHASGGFALFALAGLSSTRRGRAIGITIGLTSGTAMGLYQMFKGAHYLSHTFVTAIFCWIVFLGWRLIFSALQTSPAPSGAGEILPESATRVFSPQTSPHR